MGHMPQVNPIWGEGAYPSKYGPYEVLNWNFLPLMTKALMGGIARGKTQRIDFFQLKKCMPTLKIESSLGQASDNVVLSVQIETVLSTIINEKAWEIWTRVIKKHWQHYFLKSKSWLEFNLIITFNNPLKTSFYPITIETHPTQIVEEYFLLKNRFLTEF